MRRRPLESSSQAAMPLGIDPPPGAVSGAQRSISPPSLKKLSALAEPVNSSGAATHTASAMAAMAFNKFFDPVREIIVVISILAKSLKNAEKPGVQLNSDVRESKKTHDKKN